MLNKLFNRLQNIVNTITAVFLASLCVVIFIQVIMRYVMGRSIAWSEELTRYMFVWIIYLGVNLGIRDDIQIKIDVLDMLCKGKSVEVLRLFQHIASLVVIAACFISSIYLIRIGLHTLSPTLRIPMWTAYLVFPIGFTLSFIEVARKIYCIVFRKKLNERGDSV